MNDKWRISYELCNLVGKYKEVVMRIGESSLMDQLLKSIDLPYNPRIMAMALPPTFKVLPI